MIRLLREPFLLYKSMAHDEGVPETPKSAVQSDWPRSKPDGLEKKSEKNVKVVLTTASDCGRVTTSIADGAAGTERYQPESEVVQTVLLHFQILKSSHRLTVRTAGFQPTNRGSIPRGSV